jgi:predicted AAA+ superfamily ATPase
MISIHIVKTLPRLVSAALSERMRVMPAVVVTGARQTGKSTLAEQLVPGARRCATLDDLDVLDAARRDPEVLVGGSTPVTLDEVQREPELLRAVKRAIDRDRKPGRFLLTGSANLLLMRQVSESLAGRASYWGDTGVAMQLAETEEPGGAHMENLVLHDLLAWRDARIEHAELGYWRTSIGEEVDFVIEAGGKLLPIEVKSTARPRIGDAAHLRTFHAEYGKKARAGLLLHTGDAIEWLAPDVLAAPWWRVL